MTGERALIVMLSDLANEAKTKVTQRMWDAHIKDREETSQETDLSGLKVDKTLCLSVVMCACVRETRKDKHNKRERERYR